MAIQGWVILNFYTALLLILLLIFATKNVKTEAGSKFNMLVAMTLILLVSETIGRIGEMYPENFFPLMEAGYFLIYLLDPVDYLLAILYIDSWMSKKDAPGKKAFRLAYVAFVVSNIVLVIFSALFKLKWFYYFEGTDYLRGPLFLWRGLVLLIFCCLTGLYTIIYRNTIFEGYRIPIFSLPTLAFIGAILQIFFADMDMTYASIAVGLLILFFFLQAKDLDIDYLTGALNRRGLDIRFEEAVRNSQATGKPFAAIMLDLDRFKSINDNYGHAEGDIALKAVADILHKVFPQNCYIGRFGGDEFCVVTNIQDMDHLDQAIEIIKDELEIWNYKSGKEYEVEISTGGLVYDPFSRQSMKSFQMAIDELMYQEKRKHHLKDNRREIRNED